VAWTDIHQHLWPPSFLTALAARSEPPRLRGRALELAGAPSWELDVASHELDNRLALMDRAELDCAVVSLQPTLGVDPELEETWEEGILELAAATGGRILPLAAREPRPGFAGLCVAGADLLDLNALAPRLDALTQRGEWLFVHPGPAGTPAGMPPWWPAIVDYTAELQAAYAAWLAGGAARWPDLDVVFAILAGGAPVQLERMVARGLDERSAMLPHIWFDVATYGRRALDLAMSTFGVEPMLFGSDLPILDPLATLDVVRSFGDAVAGAVLGTNPARLMQR
jgi:6-methylsalicylate decarboxylase